MKHTPDINILKMLRTAKAAGLAALAVLIIIACVWTCRSVRQTEVAIDVDDRIDITPEQIQQIKDIGEWEFLSVSDEQLVDTVRRGIFTDDHLVRIYYGTMRLGINMRQVEPGWLKADGDSLTVTLPAVGLLDRDFIDEARTRSFHQNGTWTAKDREALYMKAYRQMLRHGLTAENLAEARRNGEALFRQMMRAMGFEHVSIRWSEEAEKR